MRPFFLAVIFAAGLTNADPVEAQLAIGPWSSPQANVKVVDAATGAPVAGAIVVLRWDWEEYFAGGLYQGARHSYSGEQLAFFELVSDALGGVTVPAWGPIVRGKGRVDPRGPQIFVFRPGYAPLVVSAADGRIPGSLSLSPPDASPREHAKHVARMQGDLIGGLRWKRAGEGLQRMPRMLRVLHDEKARLGEDGWAILGVDQLPGRSGKGVLVRRSWQSINDENPGRSIVAVVEVEWRVLRTDGGTQAARFVDQRFWVASESSAFYVSPWRYPQPAPAGWTVDVTAIPTIRIFSAGFAHVPEQPWGESGGVVAMHALARTRESQLGELREWRRLIDEVPNPDDVVQAYGGRLPLASLLQRECDRLTRDARQGICFETDSEINRLAAASRAAFESLLNDEHGTYLRSNPRDQIRVASASPIAAQSPRVSGSGTSGVVGLDSPSDFLPVKPVSGFTIVPIGKPR